LAIGFHPSKARSALTLSLSFLSPALVKAAIEGRLPRGFGVKRLMVRDRRRVHVYDARCLANAPTRIRETEFCGQRLSTAHAADKAAEMSE
jgi:hypothetical protein